MRTWISGYSPLWNVERGYGSYRPHHIERREVFDLKAKDDPRGLAFFAVRPEVGKASSRSITLVPTGSSSAMDYTARSVALRFRTVVADRRARFPTLRTEALRLVLKEPQP